MSYTGKNVLVMGSSRGIGRGIVLKLAEMGANVGVHYYQNRDAATATMENSQGWGRDGFLVQADVCQPAEVSRIFEQVRSEFGSLDIFVSNARTEAASFYEPPMDITWRNWTRRLIRRLRPFCRGPGSCPADVGWRKDRCDHVRARRPVWELAALGCDGGGESGHGGVGAVFRRRAG